MAAGFKTLDDLPDDLTGKRVLVRVDLNVPMQDGAISDDTRLRAAVPTIAELADKGAIVLLLSHFGRPKGQSRPDMSTALLVKPLAELTGRSVRFVEDCQGAEAARAISIMLPGIDRHPRKHPLPCRRGEERSRSWPRAWPRSAIITSTTPSPPRTAPMPRPRAWRICCPAYAGRAMEAELNALEKALGNPERPVAAVVGGAKVSTKLAVLGNLVGKVDHLIIGGGMANTFLAARGVDVGKSLCEHDLVGEAEAIFDARRRGRLHHPSAL